MHHSDMRRAHEIEGARIARELVSGEHVDEIATIIDGHDSRLEALSLNDSLVKDADKLWRYTTTGVAVGCDWFGMTPGEYADWKLFLALFLAPDLSMAAYLGGPALDFVALATGMGVPATRATTAEELADQLRRALAEPGPHLIDAVLAG